MPLEPGPFGQALPAAVSFTATDYGLTDYAKTELADVDDGLNTIDLFEELIGGVVLINDASSVLPDLSDVVLAWASQFPRIDFPSIETIGLSLLSAESQLGNAIQYAPAAAWVDQFDTFVPPDPSATISTPTLPLSGYNPTYQTPVGVIVPGSGQKVSLFNLSRVGQANFWVGDNFLVQVEGAPGSDVSYNAFLQGRIFGTADLGPIDSTGLMQVKGQMLPDFVGAWTEDWYINSLQVAQLNFVVLEAS